MFNRNYRFINHLCRVGQHSTATITEKNASHLFPVRVVTIPF